MAGKWQEMYCENGEGELKSMILVFINGPDETLASTKSTDQPAYNIIAPNLSSCHESLTDANRRVYCCPPYYPDEPIVDFQFPDPTTTPLRIRRPAHKLTPEFIQNYSNAIKAMQSLPLSDPRNFLRQAALHCIFCTGSYDQILNSPTDHRPPGIIKIHRSWLFMPWHRMLFYFHERIVGDLIGDPTFGLPYWNWDTPEGMRDVAHLPPATANDNYDYDESHSGEELVQSNLALLYHQMVSGARKAELFHGCSYKAGQDGACDGAGTIELAPHNPLHTWVGSNLQPEREDLGAFYTAGKDPLFYAHHSNVDRMWELWQRSRAYQPEITDPDWLDSYFFFYDEKLQLTRIKIRDVLKITNLRYTYEEADLPWLNAKPKPSIPPKIAKNALKMRERNELRNGSAGRLRFATHLSMHFGSEGRILHEMVRIKVKRPRVCRTEKEKEEEEEVLVVYGINVMKDKYAKFDVFVNAVNETGLGPQAREFAGTFVNGRMGAKRPMVNEIVKKTVLKVGITELLEDLEADCDEFIWVSLVPRCHMGDYISFQGVRIEFMR
ncbi:hypothetical protein Scep_000697 [Stephania cephalantha]|uniref:Tyrosinase copper-binding domain-containing protein n=1 Tax=Stephania cephalantha TaxID=152367 RepID=A0AAP0Q6Z2_9MAGN